MEHIEYWLTVDGAYEADIITDTDGQVISNGDPGSSPDTLDDWLIALAHDALPDGAGVELDYRVYRISHGNHDLQDECECSQFETDHTPIWSSTNGRDVTR